MPHRALPRSLARFAAALSLVAFASCARERGLGTPLARGGVEHADARGTAGYPLSDASPEAPVVEESPAADRELPAATYREAMPSSLDPRAPASTYAALSASACRAEVKRRDLPVAAVKSAQRGVSGAMRVTGPMNGVRVVVPPDTSKFGILDCRLTLVLDDFTKSLTKSGVVGLRIDNFYRPGAKLPGRKKASQHARGLAMDIVSFQLADGRKLATSDWGAAIGEIPCGPDAVDALPTAESVEVRNLVCAVGRSGLFHTLLTPSFDAAHQSHFHFDIKADPSRTNVR